MNAHHDPAITGKIPPHVHVILLLLLLPPVPVGTTALQEENVALTVPTEALVSDAHAAPTEKEPMAEQPVHAPPMATVAVSIAHATDMATAEQPDAPLCGVQTLKPEKWATHVSVL